MGKAQALFSILESELKVQGFDIASPLLADDSPKEAAAKAIAKSFLKKFQEGDDVPELAKSRAILTFIESLDKAEKWVYAPKSFTDPYIFNDVKFLLHKFWEPKTEGHGNPPVPLFTITDLGGDLKVGPGSAIMAKGGDIYSKLFASPLSYSSESLAFWYRRLISPDTTWSAGEKHRFELYGSRDAVVRGSRLFVAPKNSETGRCACTEPNINMVLQLSAGIALSKRLEKVYGIGLDTQPSKNQALARLGSRGFAVATVDLKSASDSLSMRMLQETLPSTMFFELCRIRSPEVEIPGLGWRSLSIISTMGNGFTFPLQTILFTCIVHACYRMHDIKLITGENANFGVFGDDIVCDVKVVRTLYSALDLFGFTVNNDKSFFEGPFRESCGKDYFHGYDIRGFYLKSLRSQQDFYVAVNRLTEWSSRTGIYLPKTTSYLLARCKWLPVPLWENDDAGIKVPYAMVARKLRFSKFTQSPLYRYYSAKPVLVEIGVDERQENPMGALVALLYGAIRSGCVAKRTRCVRYTLKWNSCPQWDYPSNGSKVVIENNRVTITALSGQDRDFLVQRWNTAAAFNLYG